MSRWSSSVTATVQGTSAGRAGAAGSAAAGAFAAACTLAWAFGRPAAAGFAAAAAAIAGDAWTPPGRGNPPAAGFGMAAAAGTGVAAGASPAGGGWDLRAPGAESTGASSPPTIVRWRARSLPGPGSAASGAESKAAAWVPSTTMAAPQRLQVMRTFRPRTFSSGTPYLAGQLVQAMFIARGEPRPGPTYSQAFSML